MLFQGNTPELLKVAATNVPMQWYCTSDFLRKETGTYWVDIPQKWEHETIESYLWHFSHPDYIFRIKP
jgi:hypothetical protein